MVRTEDIAKKAEDEDIIETEEVEVKETKKGGDKVTVQKADLQKLFDRLEGLEADKQDRADQASGFSNSPFRKTKKKMVKLHKWNGKYVLGFTEDEYGQSVFTKEDRNRPGRDKTYEVINLILDGEKEPVEVELLKFRNSPTEWVNVTKTEVEEDIQNFGAVNVKDEVKGRFVETDDIVPLDIKYEYRTYTVELPDGREVALLEKFINM